MVRFFVKHNPTERWLKVTNSQASFTDDIAKAKAYVGMGPARNAVRNQYENQQRLFRVSKNMVLPRLSDFEIHEYDMVPAGKIHPGSLKSE